MQIVDPKWVPCSAKWVSSVKLPSLFGEIKEKLRSILLVPAFVCVTVDLWTDRKMRSFMGITVHFMEMR
jgi:hypothetical protein